MAIVTMFERYNLVDNLLRIKKKLLKETTKAPDIWCKIFVCHVPQIKTCKEKIWIIPDLSLEKWTQCFTILNIPFTRNAKLTVCLKFVQVMKKGFCMSPIAKHVSNKERLKNRIWKSYSDLESERDNWNF